MTAAELTGMIPQLDHQVCVCGVGSGAKFACVYWGNVYTFIISPIIFKV